MVANHKAQYRGTGTVNGDPGYTFRLTAYDGNKPSSPDGLDRFRIKITNSSSNAVVYDNRLGAGDDIDAADPQTIAGGSIVIHK